jgi:hypothetical protein
MGPASWGIVEQVVARAMVSIIRLKGICIKKAFLNRRGLDMPMINFHLENTGFKDHSYKQFNRTIKQVKKGGR